MKKTTFSQFRNNAKKYLDTVEGGETVEIYRHGKPVAFVSPVAQEPPVAWESGKVKKTQKRKSGKNEPQAKVGTLIFREATIDPKEIHLLPPLKKPVDSLAILLEERGREQ